MLRTMSVIVCLVMIGALTGCGIKGPLTLPNPGPAPTNPDSNIQ